MSSSPIKREAQGVTVTRYTGGWPRATTIEARDKEIRLHGAEQARALIWALQEIERADKEADK